MITSAPRWISPVEMPTIGVAAIVYGGFLSLTWFYHDMPFVVAVLAGALILAFHSSFQHETIHGHPTRNRQVNSALGGAPLALWLPYEIYRESHLTHHLHSEDELTNPIFDPESHYAEKDFFLSSGWLVRNLFQANRTLAGRLLIGPALSISRLWSREIPALLGGDMDRRRLWAHHFAAVAVVLVWVLAVCRVPLTAYLIMIYLSISLAHLRSFTEHRAHPDPGFRTAVVRAHPFWGWLFLNNNLHIAHHAAPQAPWHVLPELWQEMRGKTVVNQDLMFNHGYSQIVRTYLFKPVIELEFPLSDRVAEPVKTAA